MSTIGSGSLSSAAGTSISHWAPHGAVLTACVVGINLLVILLIFVFFWRFFSGKGGPSSLADRAVADDDDEDEDSLSVVSSWASRHRHEDDDLGAEALVEDVAKALPVSVYYGAGSEEGGKAPECAVCIVELRDGDLVRVLPRCGHRFHADCVGAWLRLHATCPLCRGRVVPPAPAAIAGESRNAKDDNDAGAADCPV